MPGRPCQICSDTANLRIAAEMIASGASDQEIAEFPASVRGIDEIASSGP
jgi:hypothetical protein